MNPNFEHLDHESAPHLTRGFPNFHRGFVRSSIGNLFMSAGFRTQYQRFSEFQTREDDVWVVTFPRSGTTWAQEMVWLLCNNLDFIAARKNTHSERVPFLEECVLVEEAKWYQEQQNSQKSETNGAETNTVVVEPGKIESAPSPRFIKTHLPFEHLPKKLLDTCKVIYVARNPKDVAVSYYYMHLLSVALTTTLTFKEFAKLFTQDEVLYAPYWKHVISAWNQRNHPNFLFLFYEDMQEDLAREIRKTAEFLCKPVTEDQVRLLCGHLDIRQMKVNSAVNAEHIQRAGAFRKEHSFIREGQVGGWMKHFDEETNTLFDEWIQVESSNTDLQFRYTDGEH